MHFLLSLCVSDLISSLISWLFLYRRTWGFETWKPIPEFFCKVSMESNMMKCKYNALPNISTFLQTSDRQTFTMTAQIILSVIIGSMHIEGQISNYLYCIELPVA